MAHCFNESQWQTVWVTARACTIWWSLAPRPLMMPSKPIVYALFKLQREYWSAWKTIQSNTAVRKRTLRGRYSTLCSLTNPAKTCGHEQTSSWHSDHAELSWKILLVVGVHNDSNEDASKASDGDYQMRNLHFLLSDKGRRLLVQMDFWKALKFPAKQHL